MSLNPPWGERIGLVPSGKEVLHLPSGKRAEIIKLSSTFRRWSGEPIADTYGGKEVLEWKVEPVFAEIAVLRILQSHGWDGVWCDTFRRTFRVGMPGITQPTSLPEDKAQLLAPLGKGCWDLFLWKDAVPFFVELKRHKRDRIRTSQLRWLDAALGAGLAQDSFAFVEWDAV